MIKITRSLYDKLCSFKRSEDCGFVHGKNILNELYPVRNVANEENRFRFSFLSRFVMSLKVLFHGHNKIGIYHVHDFSETLSYRDVSNSVKGFMYIVIFKNQLFFYEIYENNKFIIQARKKDFIIIEGK